MKYAAIIQYGNREQIAKVRPVHREYLGRLKEQGETLGFRPVHRRQRRPHHLRSRVRRGSPPPHHGRPLPRCRRLRQLRAKAVAAGVL